MDEGNFPDLKRICIQDFMVTGSLPLSPELQAFVTKAAENVRSQRKHMGPAGRVGPVCVSRYKASGQSNVAIFDLAFGKDTVEFSLFMSKSSRLGNIRSREVTPISSLAQLLREFGKLVGSETEVFASIDFRLPVTHISRMPLPIRFPKFSLGPFDAITGVHLSTLSAKGPDRQNAILDLDGRYLAARLRTRPTLRLDETMAMKLAVHATSVLGQIISSDVCG